MSIVTIQDVKIETITTGKKPYSKATAVFTDSRGENKNKQVMSFSNPAVFAFLSKIKSPTRVQVENDGAPYYNWTKIEAVTDEEVPRVAASPRSPTYVDNRETSEERARRQVMIVKQSSLTAALKYYEIMEEKPESANQVTDLAQFFVDWVMDDKLSGVETMGRGDSGVSEE